ncbi:EamA family transporter [Anabaena sp. FACHB-1237]|uniref:EamA family transporter n=1 Tax=Anabaena sp. FACHB-1237 TaxID=2692769 RepID=UPI00168121F0|nr:EamA family transporter [Anabaena sp. FACHB-1237]MBD2136831.1 EamA family transporter [Anabaena sp. FACHB-1237]
MGRFEKRPENPRVRGDLSRAAESALWDVVEDLENLQKNLLRTLQEDVKRLETEKNRLSKDIEKLIEEKEKLQQSRQITEQQVLIRQLAEVLAKHISSQLQSSLKTLATQALEEDRTTNNALNPSKLHNNVTEINQNLSNMIDNLDDTVTIAFSSLLQELKNYQSNLSQQLSRMYNQQQQGEAILAEFVNRLRSELEKNKETNSLKGVTGGSPTVLQINEPYKNGSTNSLEKPTQTVIVEPMAFIPQTLPDNDSTAATGIILVPPPAKTDTPSSSVIIPDPEVKNSEETNYDDVYSSDNSTKLRQNHHEPVIIPESDGNLPNLNSGNNHENQTSVIISDTSNVTDGNLPNSEEIDNYHNSQSLITPNLTTSTAINPNISNINLTNAEEKNHQSVTLVSSDVSSNVPASTPSSAVVSSARKQIKTPQKQPPQTLLPDPGKLQLGFILIALSTLVSSLYNVAIKAVFSTGSNALVNLSAQQLILPTLGNIFLILMLRLLVVVPLMIMLAPMLHNDVWQDMENLFNSLRGNGISKSVKQKQTKEVLLLSVISGCLLFLSQVLIYIAVSEVKTGSAIALFFIYPLISVFLSWFLFQERPNFLAAGAMAAIFCGEILILSVPAGFNNSSLGSITAIISGIAFAIYIILTRICAIRLKIHPVSLTLIHFTTMLLLSFICLIVPLPSNLGLAIHSSNILELILSAFLLGVLTLCGYLFNNLGIRKIGTQISSIIGATVPIITVICAGILLQESLDIIQILGVLFVTVGATSIAWKKMPNNSPNLRSRK